MAKFDDILLAQNDFKAPMEFNLIINGVLNTYQGKQVNVTKNDEGQVEYFYKESIGTSRKSKKHRINAHGERIQRHLESGKFFRINSVPLAIRQESLVVKIDKNLRSIFIESPMYKEIRDRASGLRKESHSMVISSKEGDKITLDSSQIDALVQELIDASKINYLNVVLGPRFLNKLKQASDRLGNFYSLNSIFVPILVESKYMFNPLTDVNTAASTLRFKDSSLYKYAEENGRVVEIFSDGVLTMTLLTHKEICKCLGMSYFMRFTPQFFYKFAIGQIYGGSTIFPYIQTMLKVQGLAETQEEEEQHMKDLKNAYTIADHDAKMREVALACGKAKQAGEPIELLKKKFAILQQYYEMDSLMYTLENDLHKLKIDKLALDNNNRAEVTAPLLHQYLSEASLF